MSDPPSAGGPTGAVGRSLAWLIGLGALLLLPGPQQMGLYATILERSGG